MQKKRWIAGFAVVGMLATAFASVTVGGGGVPKAWGVANCPTGTANFDGGWNGLREDDSTTDPTYYWTGGAIHASIVFTLATHTFTGNAIFTIPDISLVYNLPLTGTYNCTTGTLDGNAGGGPFEAALSTNPVALTGVSPRSLLAFNPPNPITKYVNFTWSGGLETNLVEDTGTALTTDPGDSGATPADPEQISIASPTSGALSIATATAPNGALGGYYLLAPTARIVAPNATAENPISLTFTVDASVVGSQTPVLFRDGVAISACAEQPSTVASPDPCVSSQTQTPDGDWQVVVLTSHASVWQIGVRANAPTAPHITSAATGNGKATIAWSGPLGNGGAPVTKFVVTPYLGTHAQSSHTFAKTVHSGVVAGLQNGKSYTFKVAAVNLMGTGPKSTASAAVLVGAPGPPTSISVRRVAAGALRVSFHPPANNGAPITKFTASCAPTPGSTAKSATGVASPVRVNGLTAGTTYTCRVRATNARGAGAYSVASNPVRA